MGPELGLGQTKSQSWGSPKAWLCLDSCLQQQDEFMKAGSRFSQSYLSSIPNFLHGIPETILLCLIEFHFQRWSGLQNGLLDRRPLGRESSDTVSYSPLAASCQVSWLVGARKMSAKQLRTSPITAVSGKAARQSFDWQPCQAYKKNSV